MTASERVMKAQRALKERGGRRAPGGYLQPDDVQRLDELVSSGYAPTPFAVVVAALRDAHKKINRTKG